MKRGIVSLVLGAALVVPVLGRPGAWGAGRVAAVLEEWTGDRSVLLRTEVEDPLGVPEVRDLLERLTEQGFTVLVGSTAPPPRGGLVLELRRAGEGWTAVVSRASDGAYLAVETLGGAESPNRSGGPAARTGPKRSQTLELTPQARGVVGLSMDRVVVLYDDRVEMRSLRAGAGGLDPERMFTPPVRPSRGLRVEAGDLDGDGRPEVAATWAEDVSGVYEGTHTRVHAWVLDGLTLEPRSGDLGGYVRIVGGKAYAQRRGTFEAFSGPVLRVVARDRGFALAPGSPAWPRGHHLFEATPLPGGGWLSHKADRRWSLLDGRGVAVPNGRLVADLGPFRGPAVAVRLETPEYRSGFEKEDRITERWIPLPRRVLIGASGAIYTLRRGRSQGVPFLGRPAGRDALVRLSAGPDGLRLEDVLWQEEAFVLDFALVSDGSAERIVLLAAEREDGSGLSYLRTLDP